MGYLETLGQVLREIRVTAGLSRESCAQVLNRDHLAKIEQGRLAISVLKLKALCEYLNVSQSLVLTTVEARLVGADLETYRNQQTVEFKQQILTGMLKSEIDPDSFRGVRGKRAEHSRAAIQALQAEGLAKMEIARKLGVSRATVDRYWLKP
ncbi:helix-turn-helix domain-containing protein [Pseudomonas putida]|nr:helix-turn-helix domain-containing protein [Pseudomonas putida]